MFFPFIFRLCAKEKPTSPNSWNTSFNSSQTPCTKQSKSSLRKPCAHWFATPGRATFGSSKTTSRAASSCPTTASLNQLRSKPVSCRSQRSSIPHLKKRYVEKFLQPARSPTGGSVVRKGQPPDSV